MSIVARSFVFSLSPPTPTQHSSFDPVSASLQHLDRHLQSSFAVQPLATFTTNASAHDQANSIAVSLISALTATRGASCGDGSIHSASACNAPVSNGGCCHTQLSNVSPAMQLGAVAHPIFYVQRSRKPPGLLFVGQSWTNACTKLRRPTLDVTPLEGLRRAYKGRKQKVSQSGHALFRRRFHRRCLMKSSGCCSACRQITTNNTDRRSSLPLFSTSRCCCCCCFIRTTLSFLHQLPIANRRKWL